MLARLAFERLQKMTDLSSAQRRAMYLAIVVRNAMEDFHVAHLSDAQVRELNPIIRNAIYTGLKALEANDRRAQLFLAFNAATIPDYWEAPELLESYKRKSPEGV